MESCPLTTLADDGLLQLRSADDNAVIWWQKCLISNNYWWDQQKQSATCHQWCSGRFRTGVMLTSPPPSPSFLLPPPLPLLSFPLYPSLALPPSLPLEVDTLNPARGWGSAVSSHSGVWSHPSRNQIWCIYILALKHDLWWQQFQWFAWESIFPSLCISLQAYLVKYYCITIPPCSDTIWGNGIPPKIFGKQSSPTYSLDYTSACHFWCFWF